jgi:hypothetical protein
MFLTSHKAPPHSRLLQEPRSISLRTQDGSKRGRRSVRRPGGTSIAIAILRLMAPGTQPGKPRGLLVVWPLWERIAHRLWPTMTLPQSRYGVLELRLIRYRGRPLQIPGEPSIVSGTLVGELHCNNQNLLSALMTEGANPIQIGRCELRSLARWAIQIDTGGVVKAFYGTTYISLRRLGFTRHDHPSGPRARMDRFFMLGLLAVYSRDGIGRLRRGRIALASSPPQMWISRRELLRLYGQQEPLIDLPASGEIPAILN